MEKICDVILISTNCDSVIHWNEDNHYFLSRTPKSSGTNYNVYILCDDEIREDDWIFVDYSHLTTGYNERGVWKYKEAPCPLPYWGNTANAKKIIATNDDNLCYKDSGDSIGQELQHCVPNLPRTFLKELITELNKGNLITKASVDYQEHTWQDIHEIQHAISLKITILK